jgi:hypothetical protein
MWQAFGQLGAPAVASPSAVDACRGLLRGQFEQADAAIGAGDGEAAGTVFDVARGGLERLAGEALRLLDGALRGHLHRCAAGEQRARTGTAKAVGTVGVAVHDADLLERHAEHVDRQLREAGVDALPHRHGGHRQLDDAFGQHVHRHHLRQRVAAGPFEEGGDAAAAQAALRLRRHAARLEALPVGQRQALVEHLLELADVVGLPHRILVGHLRGADHVAAAQLGAVDLQSRARRRPSAAR